MQRCLFVRLEADLDQSRRSGIFSAIKVIPGVELVCDLSVVSPETLCDVLLIEDPPQQKLGRRQPSLFKD